MNLKLTALVVFVVMTATLVFVSSQSTVGQYGMAKYQHHCMRGGKCQYVVTLPPCKQDDDDCVDYDDGDKTTLTQLLQIVSQQSHQIQELTDYVQNQSGIVQRQSDQIQELTDYVQNQSVLVQRQSDQIQELSLLLQNLSREQNTDKGSFMRDCSDLWDYAGTVNIPGVHQISPFGLPAPISIYCEQFDFNTWTVIQRRLDGSVNFTRNWQDYKDGFGNIDGEFWLGNENIHALTNQAPYKLRIDLEDWDGTTTYAEYNRFWIEDEAHNYTLHIGEYSGTAGDSMKNVFPFYVLDGQSFSTYDRDDDKSHVNCAVQYNSGWWFSSCRYANLNEPYESEGVLYKGIYWYNTDGGSIYSRKSASMKIMKIN